MIDPPLFSGVEISERVLFACVMAVVIGVLPRGFILFTSFENAKAFNGPGDLSSWMS